MSASSGERRSACRRQNRSLWIFLLLLPTTCLFGRSAETGTYVFVADQSKVVQTGGIAHVQWTYSVEGQFQLAIDANAGTASFVRVDANATDDSPFKRTLDPNHVFNMTSLVGTVVDSTNLSFSGKASDGSDILITVSLADNVAHLIGQTTPPPNSADFFIFSLDAVAQRKYGGGSGTADDPYQIATAADLIALGHSPEDYDKHFILTADIDLDPNLPGGKVFDEAVVAPDTDPTSWDFQRTSFTGVFDGNGHKMWNFTYDSNDTYNIGFFGYIDHGNAQVKNLSLIDPSIDAGTASSVGPLAGRLIEGSISGCHVLGGTVSGGSCVGGLVGYIDWGTVTQCSSTASVTGSSTVGGLAGKNYGGSIVSSCSTGSVTGESSVGGFVGSNMAFADIVNCYATGDVTGDRNVAGIAGHNSCRGVLGTIRNCYSVGRVTGTEYVGGIVGWNCGAVESSFWNTETSGINEPNYGEGRTTAQMHHPDTFRAAGWDFIGESENGTEDIWAICEGVGYPHLAWEFVIGDFDADADTDFADFCILAEHWLAADGSFWCGAGGTDLTNDGNVDSADLDELADNWLAGVE
jgi:hypothetical protein